MNCDPNRDFSHHSGCACHEARHAAEIERLTNQLTEARDEIHNANLRADRALRDRNEVGARLAALEARHSLQDAPGATTGQGRGTK